MATEYVKATLLTDRDAQGNPKRRALLLHAQRFSKGLDEGLSQPTIQVFTPGDPPEMHELIELGSADDARRLAHQLLHWTDMNGSRI